MSDRPCSCGRHPRSTRGRGYEISPVFAADSAVFTLPGFIGLLIFLTAYWRVSPRFGDGLFGIALCATAGCAIEQPEGWKFVLSSVSHPGFPC